MTDKFRPQRSFYLVRESSKHKWEPTDVLIKKGEIIPINGTEFLAALIWGTKKINYVFHGRTRIFI